MQRLLLYCGKSTLLACLSGCRINCIRPVLFFARCKRTHCTKEKGAAPQTNDTREVPSSAKLRHQIIQQSLQKDLCNADSGTLCLNMHFA